MRTMTDPPAPQLTPSEWLIFRVVRHAGRPLAAEDVAACLPSLPAGTVLALVGRLAERQVLRRQEDAFSPASYDEGSLLRQIFEGFLESYCLSDPEDLAVLSLLLEARRKGDGAVSSQPEVG
jgi:hypothetical protein